MIRRCMARAVYNVVREVGAKKKPRQRGLGTCASGAGVWYPSFMAHVAWAKIKLAGLPVERQRTSGLLTAGAGQLANATRVSLKLQSEKSALTSLPEM